MVIRNYFQACEHFHSVSVFTPVVKSVHLSLHRSVSYICEKHSVITSLHRFFTSSHSVIAWENVNKGSLRLCAVNGFIRLLLGLKEFSRWLNVGQISFF